MFDNLYHDYFKRFSFVQLIILLIPARYFKKIKKSCNLVTFDLFIPNKIYLNNRSKAKIKRYFKSKSIETWMLIKDGEVGNETPKSFVFTIQHHNHSLQFSSFHSFLFIIAFFLSHDGILHSMCWLFFTWIEK